MNEDANAAADAEMNGRRLHTEGAEVEVLVAGDAADARLPPPVLVVPALASTTTNSQMKTPGKSESFSECSAVKKNRHAWIVHQHVQVCVKNPELQTL